ncbi:hypothetical protein C0583_03870 [Candidatus Parcubacteria bacterium]|nr:MAG: hypothetical protein C0583_03870 [Candidatus Parcubacteria bacterium]
MKINFITVSNHLTGGNRVIMELVNGLARKGHELNIVTLGNKDDLNWINIEANIIEVKRNFFQKIVGYGYRKAFGFQSWPEEQTRMLIKNMPEADVSIATMSYTGFSVARQNKSLPFQLHMHYEPYVRGEGYTHKVMKECYHLPVNIIANSTWVKNTIKKENNKECVGVVCPAIDHNVFYKRKEFKPINKNNVKIVSLSKHKIWKGIPEALKTIKILRDRGYNIEFKTFGGDFPSDKLSNELKDVIYSYEGRKENDELAKFYSEADILISSSYYESFPLPQLEAMACGTPVVTTKYGTEDYAYNNENCYVVEPKNPEMMAMAIEKLINSPEIYKKFSERGVETAKKFTWDKSVDLLESILLK